MTKNTILHYSFLIGLFASGAYFLFVVILSLIGINPFMKYEFLFLPIYGIAFAFGIRYFKKENKGQIQGWQAITLTVLGNFTAALLYGVGLMVLFQLMPSIVEVHKTEMLNYYQAVESTISSNLSEEQIQNLMVGISNITAKDLVFDKIIKTGAVGLPVAMIMALLFKRL